MRLREPFLTCLLHRFVQVRVSKCYTSLPTAATLIAIPFLASPSLETCGRFPDSSFIPTSRRRNEPLSSMPASLTVLLPAALFPVVLIILYSMKFMKKKYVDILNNPDGYMNSQAHSGTDQKSSRSRPQCAGTFTPFRRHFTLGESSVNPKPTGHTSQKWYHLQLAR